MFCQIVARRLPASIVHESEHHLAFMDLYPWRPGHVLVVPKAHAVRLEELGGEPGELFALGARLGAALRASSIPCDDLNYLLNDGPLANQTVPHVHLHVLPRRRGDLPMMVGALLKRPMVPFVGAANRAALDRQACELAAAIAR